MCNEGCSFLHTVHTLVKLITQPCYVYSTIVIVAVMNTCSQKQHEREKCFHDTEF